MQERQGKQGTHGRHGRQGRAGTAGRAGQAVQKYDFGAFLFVADGLLGTLQTVPWKQGSTESIGFIKRGCSQALKTLDS